MAGLDLGAASLFLDVDGTLLEFAPRPEDVVVERPLIATLARAYQALNGAIAFVSGRRIEDLDAIFRPLRFAAAGVHGAELRVRPDAPTVHAPSARLPERLVGWTTKIAERFPGAFVEDKVRAVALHCHAPRETREAIHAAVRELVETEKDPTLVVMRGHDVVEIRRRDYDKGGAIEKLMRRPEFAGRRPVFIGDDVTDLPGFLAVMREGGDAYSVGRVIPGLTGSFANPAAVRDWLTDLTASRATPS